jgi:hypothetical protein
VASPEPFQPYRKVQASHDQELARILEITARQIRMRLLRMKPGVSGDIRKAQLNLTLSHVTVLQRTMWLRDVMNMVKRGVDAGAEAGESAVETLTRVAYAALPEQAAQALVDGLKAAAASGLKSDQARRKRELSRNVYFQSALHTGKVEDMIRAGVISNLSAKELADSVYEYVSPSTRGGASYAAMRLARTEINNAFHERQLEGSKRPGVKAVKWNLSGSHRVPDLCNVYAAHDKGSGEWPVDQVPDKPHPQCFCFLTYVMMSSEEFQDALRNGAFDDEIDRRTRENVERLGGVDRRNPEGQPEPTKQRPSKQERESRPVVDLTTRKASEKVDRLEPDPLNRVTGVHRDKVQGVLDDQRKWIPNAMRYFNGVRLMSASEAKEFKSKFGQSALGGYTVETAEIGIHPEVFTPKYEKEFQRSLRTGFFSKCGHNHDGAESFIAHEMGHHVDRQLRLATSKDVSTVWKAVAEAFDLKAPLLTDKRSLDKWVERNKAAIAAKVSRYGSDSAAELLAEVWAEYTTNENPRPAIRAIGQVMRTLAERMSSRNDPDLPKTQVDALSKLKNGMTRDEWAAAGGNLNAIDVLVRKKIVVRQGKKTVKIHGESVEQDTFYRP